MTPGPAIVDAHRRAPGVVTAVGLLAVVVAAVGMTGQSRAWPYLVVLVSVASTVAMVAAGGRLSTRTLRAFAALALAHLVGGLVPAPGRAGMYFYEHWLIDGVVKYDQLVHACGTALVAVAAAELLTPMLQPSASRRALWTMAGLAACGVGAVNEVFEFVMAQRITTLQIGDAANTGWDLTFNLLGAGVAMLVGIQATPRSAPRGQGSRTSASPVVTRPGSTTSA